jgi:hypothetical protein
METAKARRCGRELRDEMMDDGVFQDHEGARKDVIGFVPRGEARYQSYQRQNWLAMQQAIYVPEQLFREDVIRATCESTKEMEHGT